MRNGRAPRRVGRRAVIAGSAALAGVRARADGAQLVPGAQREHRGGIPGAPRSRRGGGRAGALLHERGAGARAVCARARRGAAPGARAVRSTRPPARRLAARDGRRLPLTRPRAAEPLSARARRGELYRRRAASRPDARLRGDRSAAPALYEWSAEELAEPRVLDLVREGNPVYAWPFEERHVWRTPEMPFAARVLERPPEPAESRTYSASPIASIGRERSARRVGSASATSASSAEPPRIAAS